MSELNCKTLKNFNEALSTPLHPFKNWATWEFIKGILKQEAIKWIKDRISNCVFSCRNNHQRCKEHKFWMERFNITEADLKDGKSS